MKRRKKKIFTAAEVLAHTPRLVSAAEDLVRVKAELPKADRQIRAAQTALATAENKKALLVAQHKELQETLKTEALLVKPE